MVRLTASQDWLPAFTLIIGPSPEGEITVTEQVRVDRPAKGPPTYIFTRVDRMVYPFERAQPHEHGDSLGLEERLAAELGVRPPQELLRHLQRSGVPLRRIADSLLWYRDHLIASAEPRFAGAISVRLRDIEPFGDSPQVWAEFWKRLLGPGRRRLPPTLVGEVGSFLGQLWLPAVLSLSGYVPRSSDRLFDVEYPRLSFSHPASPEFIDETRQLKEELDIPEGTWTLRAYLRLGFDYLLDIFAACVFAASPTPNNLPRLRLFPSLSLEAAVPETDLIRGQPVSIPWNLLYFLGPAHCTHADAIGTLRRSDLETRLIRAYHRKSEAFIEARWSAYAGLTIDTRGVERIRHQDELGPVQHALELMACVKPRGRHRLDANPDGDWADLTERAMELKRRQPGLTWEAIASAHLGVSVGTLKRYRRRYQTLVS